MRKALVLAAALAAFAPAGATTIYSNFAPGYYYDNSYGYTGYSEGGSAGLFGRSAVAARFTSPFDSVVEQIDLFIGNAMGADTATVGLWTESGGLPGAALASWNISGIAPVGSPDMIFTIAGISGVNLSGGSNYFLVVGPVDPADDSANVWDAPGTNVVGFVPSDFGFGWDPSGSDGILEPGFDILGTGVGPGGPPAVPEPASIALMIGGVAGVARLRRRKAQK